MMRSPDRLTAAARHDIQGFVASGYGHLPSAAYLFVRFADGDAGREWLGAMADAIATAAPWPRDPDGAVVKPSLAINLAFTAEGLRTCGLPESVLCTFPAEFQEGMASPARGRILGDTGDSAPDRWEIGGPAAPVHAVLIVHAPDDARLEAVCRSQADLLERCGAGRLAPPAGVQRGYRPATDTEPFGFHDGITQPPVAGLDGDEGVPTGEFILGYPNHYGVIPPTPVVPAVLDQRSILPALENPYHEADGWRDLGRHGSFVVYRKLRQHVGRFWQALRDESIRQRGTASAAHMIWLASKMVGRWPGGAPLIAAPDRDDPALAGHDAFEYGGDAAGLACPIGAHIRRAHPRDDLKPYPRENSRRMSDAHRLLRRARVFGPPLFDHAILAPGAAGQDALLALEEDGRPRGIHFFCVNASIRSQFEFVQQTWCNNPRFGGLSQGKDPLVGDHAAEPPTCMTIPTAAGALRTAALPRVVSVSGGAYLFMPGVTALRFLAAGTYV